MENGKPFIFIHPLSKALQLLLEDFNAKAEVENLEIYELESVDEVTQVLPSLGQSLSITSSPKKCAQILQANKNVIKKQNLKFILVSPKTLPWKLQEKLSQIGLTECAVEPLPQRTLTYKVNLHLKSIKVQTEDESSSKTLGANGDTQFNDMDKQNLEKGQRDLKSDEPDHQIEPPRKNSEIKDLLKSGLSLDEQDQEEDLMKDLKGLREELGGNLRGDSNHKDETGGNYEGDGEKADVLNDLKGTSSFKDKEQGGNYEGDVEKADVLNDLKGTSSFKDKEQGGNYEGDTEKADILNDLKGKSQFKEQRKRNLEGKLNTPSPTDENKKKDLKEQLEDQKKKNTERRAKQQKAEQLRALEEKKQNDKEAARKKEKRKSEETKEEAKPAPLSLSKDKEKKRTEGWEGHSKKAPEKKHEKISEAETQTPYKREKQVRSDKQDKRERNPARSLDADKAKKKTEGWRSDSAKGMNGKGQKSDEVEAYYGKKKEKSPDKKPDQKKAKTDSPIEEKKKRKQPGYSFESVAGRKKEIPVMERDDSDKTKDEGPEAESESLLSGTGSEIKYEGPKDWGEQTIDYRKLNEEFGGFTTDREGDASGGGISFEEGTTTPIPSAEDETLNDSMQTGEIPLIEAVSNGLDELVIISELYAGRKSSSKILDYIAKRIVSKGALWCLFCSSNGEKLKLSSFEGVDPRKASSLILENGKEWVSQGLPVWSDPTFKNAENFFLFPYYEGISPLGIMIVNFPGNITEDITVGIEMLAEGARGIFLENHIKVEVTKTNKVGGLARLFGKKAG